MKIWEEAGKLPISVILNDISGQTTLEMLLLGQHIASKKAAQVEDGLASIYGLAVIARCDF